jgi:hypothetical protein
MLSSVLRHLRNWFEVPGGVHCGTFAVENGGISLPFLKDGQYFRIKGSVFNDGIYQYGKELQLQDETFNGSVWALAIPKELLDTVKDIEAWNEKNAEVVEGPYSSESFGGYSYTKSPGGYGWQMAFRGRLNQWRKI